MNMAVAVQKRSDLPEDAGAQSAAAARVDILVVDDLPEKLVAYRAILDELGQNLITAGSGEEALRLVLRHDFAVILLDVNMAGMDGFETASMIRQRKKSDHTPIIFLTAFTDEMNIAQGYATGAVDFLTTPVVPEILKAKVRVFIELFQMRQQVASQAEERTRRKAAEEADRRKDEFLGVLAHELRNPLGPICNAIHLLQMLGPEEQRVQHLRDIIGRQAKHMSRLVDDLLDCTRLSRGQILLRKERCDLTNIVRQTAEDYRSILEAGGLKLEIGIPAQPLSIDGDSTRLAQIVGNLLHNAHKFTGRGDTVTVQLEYLKDAGVAAITVRDTGIGIDAATMPKIFDVFHQADQGLDRTRGGLGLGLALVKGFATLHGGDVGAYSEGAGSGATFTIRLPVTPAALAGEAADVHPPASASGKYRILVIEDNRDAAETIKLFLNLEGYEVQAAYDGSQGLEAARNFQPRVILCDIGLPGIDGYQVVRRLRQDPAFSSVYTIALTGYGRDEDQKNAREAGFNLHLIKPLDYNNLRQTLAGLAVARDSDL
jgi:signal transduction histidine kinase